MTFLELKLVFLNKTKYIILYYNNFFFSFFQNHLKTNFINVHMEIVNIYNFFFKKKNIVFINYNFLNKKICLNCKKKTLFIKIFFKKKSVSFKNKRKKLFWVVSSDR
ncbi:hypothetical protein V7Z28_00735 [Candidatus Carsonella ruddii]|uniref:hypothetical protein n=1 Tax=Carsonella ruddii TaxID=114186 RepID=UPI003D812B79